MKIIIKQISIILSLFFIASCSDNDTVTDALQDSTERGTVLKTIDSELQFEVGEENLVSVTAEVIDQRGQDFEKIDVFLSFTDTSVDEDDPSNISKEEALFETFTPEDLESGGEFPVLNFDFTGDEFDSFFNFDQADYAGGGRINIRMELVMNDGRVFTNDNVNSVVSGGTFYRSPFFYSMNLICQPAEPLPGTWTLELQDSFGDGWNGAEAIVTIDGVETSYAIDDGGTATETIEVPNGTQVISVVFVSGSFDGEITFQFISPDGDTIIDAGPGPAAGPELINYCGLDYRL